jgi:hypothetical protein
MLSEFIPSGYSFLSGGLVVVFVDISSFCCFELNSEATQVAGLNKIYNCLAETINIVNNMGAKVSYSPRRSVP